jgi:hypothetical protein
MFLFLNDDQGPRGLRMESGHWWIRLASRVLVLSLDRRLSEGCSRESGVLLASRAEVLVSPALRDLHELTPELAVLCAHETAIGDDDFGARLAVRRDLGERRKRRVF